MKFIILTDSRDGEPVWINMVKVRLFYRIKRSRPDPDITHIVFCDNEGSSIMVREKPEEIWERLK